MHFLIAKLVASSFISSKIKLSFLRGKRFFSFFFIMIYLLGGSDCRCGLARRVAKIVGGVNTEVNEYPWQAGLVSKGNPLTLTSF